MNQYPAYMENHTKPFYSKIMLFGEYSILVGGNALLMPFHQFHGELDFINKNYSSQEMTLSNKQLKIYNRFLKTSDIIKTSQHIFDIQQYETDLRKGLYFNSKIPKGYGLGSSGALCAALYHKYNIKEHEETQNYTPEQIHELKTIFSIMESYFHGNSSGLDPLTCFINLPLFIKNKTIINFIKPPLNNTCDIFLVDTGKPHQTKTLVDYFYLRSQEKSFSRMIHSELIPTANQCIHSFLTGDVALFFVSLEKLSVLQATHFKPMIPPEFIKHFQEGTVSGNFYLKLCGAGGGGFLLGYTKNFELLKKYFTPRQLIKVRLF